MHLSSKWAYYAKSCPIIIILLIIATKLNLFSYKSSEAQIDIARKSPNTSQEQEWAPQQQDIDQWENNAPFLHCPHGSDRRNEGLTKFKELVAANESSFCSCPSEVTFLLVTNLPEDQSPDSEHLYRLCGCNYAHVRLDSESAWLGMQWNFKYKVTPALQWLETNHASLPEDSFIMFSDAFDTGLIGDASNMVQHFLDYDCEMLGMSTVADWPPNKEFKLFESEKYPWSKCRPHLSSGAWMARVADALSYLRMWEADWTEKEGGMTETEKTRGWDDQMAFRRLHKRFYPRFKVDTLAKIWTRSDSSMDCI
eukprot:GFUD01002805.1.p1 GENE.GFUD01002805.1~~GFUD01002805.1.p1  ORF type:complete len:310 (+),score=76.06 GFUD01002805.1:38-967(+)